MLLDGLRPSSAGRALRRIADASLLTHGRTRRDCELRLAWSLQSGPVGSRAAIRLLAGTEAMPAWDEACERTDKKTPEAARCRTRPSALPKPASYSAPQRTQLRSRGDHWGRRPSRKCRAARATARRAFIDPHIAATLGRAHSCELARANRLGSKSNDCGARPLESTQRNAIARRTAVARRSREKTTLS